MARGALETSGGLPLDYLNHAVASCYFDTREHEAYYRSLKHVGPRRAFHARLIEVLERFFHATSKPQDQQIVTLLIAEERRADCAREHLPTVLQEVRATHARGLDLLQLEEPLTFESLKTRYRTAARNYHPDVGGTHDDMLQINEAYSHCHQLLRLQQLDPDHTSTESGVVRDQWQRVENFEDYRFVVGELLFSVSLDDWDLRAAYAWLTRVMAPEWRSTPFTRAAERQIAIVEPASNLVKRLATAHMEVDARTVLEFVRDGAQLARDQGLSYTYYVKDSEQVLAGRKKLQVRLNHGRQAENAYRLGIIDEKRLKKTVSRLEAADSSRDQAYRDLNSRHRFLPNLPSDAGLKSGTTKSTLVLEPGYGETRVSELTEDQQAEYLRAFSDQGDGALVQKYLFVRLQSLLESAVLLPGQLDLSEARKETVELGALGSKSFSYLGQLASEAISYVHSLSESDRRARAGLLRQLQTYRDPGPVIILGAEHPFALGLDQRSLDLIKRPIEDLEYAVAHGSLPVTDEERREQEAWNRDHEKLDGHEIKRSERAAFAAVDDTKAHPERAVPILESHCNRLLALGGEMIHVQELQLGYWVDRLTMALVKLRRWPEAQAWIERFLALPDRYRQRSSPSEQQALGKRLERCVRMHQKARS